MKFFRNRIVVTTFISLMIVGLIVAYLPMFFVSSFSDQGNQDPVPSESEQVTVPVTPSTSTASSSASTPKPNPTPTQTPATVLPTPLPHVDGRPVEDLQKLLNP